MKFRNKITKVVVEAKTYAEKFAYSHNSNFEEVKEVEKPVTTEKVRKETKTKEK